MLTRGFSSASQQVVRPIPLAPLAVPTATALFASCGGGTDNGSNGSGSAASFSEVKQIEDYLALGVPAASLYLDDDATILTLKRVIFQRVVEVKDMPLQNATGMTQDERDRVGSWYEAGAKP